MGSISFLQAAGMEEEQDQLTVLASTSIVTDVAQNIAGDALEIRGLMALGENPHNYAPTPRDMAQIETADLIFVSGLGLEEGLMNSISNVAEGTIIEVSSRVVPIEFGNDHDEHDEDHDDHEEDHDEDHHDHDQDPHDHDQDPHTWTSPLNVILWVDVIEEALVEIDPENAPTYRKNADIYRQELTEVHQQAVAAFSSIPEENRLLVADHNSFGYFARDYSFTNFGALIPSFSTNTEVSAGDLTELIESVEEHQIKALFMGNTANDSLKKLGNVLVEEADHEVTILPVLTGSLTDGGEGSTYLDFITYNIEQIAKGLGGS